MNSHDIKYLRLSRLSRHSRFWLPLSILPGLAFFACQSGDQRSPSQGTATEGKILTTQDTAPISTVPNGNGEGNSGNNSSGSGGEQFGRSLEQCTSEKKAWRAVVNSGQSPAECTDPLVSWCCTREEVLARFPTMAEKVDSEFKKFIDDEKHVLYHCSTSDGGNRTTFHMAKTDGAQIFYRTVYVERVFPIETGKSTSDCPVVTTKDLAVGTSSTPSGNTDNTDPDIGETTDDVQP